MLRAAEQRGKARTRIKARPAEPVDRAVAADKGRRLAVADESIVFDPPRHLQTTMTRQLNISSAPANYISSAPANSGIECLRKIPPGAGPAGLGNPEGTASADPYAMCPPAA